MTQHDIALRELKTKRFISQRDLFKWMNSPSKILSDLHEQGLIWKDWHEDLRTGKRFKVYGLRGE